MPRLARRLARTLAIFCGAAIVMGTAFPPPAQAASVTDIGGNEKAAAEPFGLGVYQAPLGPLWIKWRGMDEGLAADAETLARCRADGIACSPAARRFLAIVDEARGLDGRQRLGVVNRAVNLAIRYTSDVAQHGVPDYWSSPLSTFASEQGDCEDYAIAKFLALREAGVAAEDLRLLIAQNRAANEAHAVLAARQDGHWLILDNRRMSLVDDAHSADLAPLFALDDRGVMQFGAPTIRYAFAARPDATPATADRHEVGNAGGGSLPLVM